MRVGLAHIAEFVALSIPALAAFIAENSTFQEPMQNRDYDANGYRESQESFTRPVVQGYGDASA
jgi:hypothetical protein